MYNNIESDEELVKPRERGFDSDISGFPQHQQSNPYTFDTSTRPYSITALEPLGTSIKHWYRSVFTFELPKDVSDTEALNPSSRSADKGVKRLWSKLTAKNDARYPLSQRIEDKRRGIGRQRYPVLTWVLSLVMVAVFIYESVINWKAQGTPFSFKVWLLELCHRFIRSARRSFFFSLLLIRC